MRLNVHFFALIIIIAFLFSCEKKREPAVISFYHWKANMNINSAQTDYLDSLGLKKLYLRFFDVHWDREKKAILPISILNWKFFDFGRSLEIVPVVYITNIALQKNEYDRGIDSLARKMAHKIQSIVKELDATRFQVKEIQLDCDWNAETQAKFFRLINQLKLYLPEFSIFSATIRLHQVKYFTTTGVPPVDKGVLMFYNMGDIGKMNEKNSILNLEKAKAYLQNFDIYPLPLDVALPLFSWGIQFREGKIVQIINDISEKDLKKNTNFVLSSKNMYKALNSCYVNGSYIYKNDNIRFENISNELLEKSMKMLRKAFGNKDFELIFYHLDGYILNSFESSFLKELAKN